ncbi:MAG: putative molybdenum carrier protein, partial [Thiohalocapsa sp.]
MSNLPDKLRLKEQAEEDQYFARRDRELVAALHARRACLVARVVSGGQTGVDRAALDAALAAGVPVGGWCP